MGGSKNNYGSISCIVIIIIIIIVDIMNYRILSFQRNIPKKFYVQREYTHRQAVTSSTNASTCCKTSFGTGVAGTSAGGARDSERRALGLPKEVRRAGSRGVGMPPIWQARTTIGEEGFIRRSPQSRQATWWIDRKVVGERQGNYGGDEMRMRWGSNRYE